MLGKVVGYTWVIEFQKRGFPHAHILLIVQHIDKPRSPEDVDMRISAELPDPGDPTKAELLRVLLSSQIHGPYGVRNPHAPCMQDGARTKKFPKEFQETTELHANGYPKNQRRESSPRVTKGAHVFDARDVVPYNPLLVQVVAMSSER